MNSNKIAVVGFSGLIAVALGALGAHYLKSKLPEGSITIDQLNGFDTAVKYQMYHTIVMFLLIIFNQGKKHPLLNWAFHSFLIGIILFSGSLYLLTTRSLIGIESLKLLGPITPVGGLFLISGWFFIALFGLKTKRWKEKSEE